MIFIHKDSEPPEFLGWKKLNPDMGYRDIPANIKEILQKSLLNEQGYICCFCGTRIGVVDKDTGAVIPIIPGERPHYKACRIAHILPQSKCSERALDYFNLSCSCPGQDGKPITEREHCDKSQKDREIYVTPLDKFCESKFQYFSDGTISCSYDIFDSSLINETIDILNLNNNRLKTRRRMAIEAIYELLNDIQIEEIARIFSSRNSQGQFSEYFFVILSFFDLFDTYYSIVQDCAKL